MFDQSKRMIVNSTINQPLNTFESLLNTNQECLIFLSCKDEAQNQTIDIFTAV